MLLLMHLEFKTFSKPFDSEMEFDRRPHPFKTFEEEEVPKMSYAERGKYDECLIESKNETALAYYLLKNSGLNLSSKAAAKSCFIKFV